MLASGSTGLLVLPITLCDYCSFFRGTKMDLTFHLFEEPTVLALATNFMEEMTWRHFGLVPKVREDDIHISHRIRV